MSLLLPRPAATDGAIAPWPAPLDAHGWWLFTSPAGDLVELDVRVRTERAWLASAEAPARHKDGHPVWGRVFHRGLVIATRLTW